MSTRSVVSVYIFRMFLPFIIRVANMADILIAYINKLKGLLVVAV